MKNQNFFQKIHFLIKLKHFLTKSQKFFYINILAIKLFFKFFKYSTFCSYARISESKVSKNCEIFCCSTTSGVNFSSIFSTFELIKCGIVPWEMNFLEFFSNWIAKRVLSGYFFELKIPQLEVAKNFSWINLADPGFPWVEKIIFFCAKYSL